MSALLEAGNGEAGQKVCNTFFRTVQQGSIRGLKVPDDAVLIAGTGPRSLAVADQITREAVVEALTYEVRRLKKRYADQLVVVSGGAEGFDEAWFKVAEREGVATLMCAPSQNASFYAWGPRGSQSGRDRTAQLRKMLDSATHQLWVDEQIYVERETGVWSLAGDDGPFVDWARGTSHWKRQAGTEHINMVRNRYMTVIADGFEVFASDSPGTNHCLRTIKQAKVPYRFV